MQERCCIDAHSKKGSDGKKLGDADEDLYRPRKLEKDYECLRYYVRAWGDDNANSCRFYLRD